MVKCGFKSISLRGSRWTTCTSGEDIDAAVMAFLSAQRAASKRPAGPTANIRCSVIWWCTCSNVCRMQDCIAMSIPNKYEQALSNEDSLQILAEIFLDIENVVSKSFTWGALDTVMWWRHVFCFHYNNKTYCSVGWQRILNCWYEFKCCKSVLLLRILTVPSHPTRTAR